MYVTRAKAILQGWKGEFLKSPFLQPPQLLKMMLAEKIRRQKMGSVMTDVRQKGFFKRLVDFKSRHLSENLFSLIGQPIGYFLL